jgi:uncharacterized UBP type Zn finger protein
MTDTELHSLISKYASQARIAREHDKVYKDECVYTHDTAECADGLFVCLNSFIAVSKPFLPIHYAKNHTNLYLRMKIYRKEAIRLFFRFLSTKTTIAAAQLK